jgi:alkylation response protein AidB-like acyl-CoA dehydrogenase
VSVFARGPLEDELEEALLAATGTEGAARLRRALQAPLEAHRGELELLDALGVGSAAVPTTHGGLGLSLATWTGLLEAAGYAGLASPLVELLVLGPAVLADVVARPGAPPTASDWLRRVADAHERVALGAARGLVECVLDGRGDAARMEFVVQDLELADAVVLVAPDSCAIARAVDLEKRGAPSRGLDPGWYASVVRAKSGTAVVLASGEEAGLLARRVVWRGAIATSALLLGLARRLVELAVGYASERRQFGRPIGSFQAVQHQIANAEVRLRFAMPAVRAAAVAFDHDVASVPCDVAVAKSLASDAAWLAARVALQVHGAIGYTFEHELHLWMRRVWRLAVDWGRPQAHRLAMLGALLAHTGASIPDTVRAGGVLGAPSREAPPRM